MWHHQQCVTKKRNYWRGKSIKQKLLEIFQVTVTILFCFDEIRKINSYGQKTLILAKFIKKQHKMYVLVIPSSFFRLHQNKNNLER